MSASRSNLARDTLYSYKAGAVDGRRTELLTVYHVTSEGLSPIGADVKGRNGGGRWRIEVKLGGIRKRLSLTDI